MISMKPVDIPPSSQVHGAASEGCRTDTKRMLIHADWGSRLNRRMRSHTSATYRPGNRPAAAGSVGLRGPQTNFQHDTSA